MHACTSSIQVFISKWNQSNFPSNLPSSPIPHPRAGKTQAYKAIKQQKAVVGLLWSEEQGEPLMPTYYTNVLAWAYCQHLCKHWQKVDVHFWDLLSMAINLMRKLCPTEIVQSTFVPRSSRSRCSSSDLIRFKHRACMVSRIISGTGSNPHKVCRW